MYLAKILSGKQFVELAFHPFRVGFRQSGVPSIHEIELNRDYITLAPRRDLVIDAANSLKGHLSMEEDTCIEKIYSPL